MDHMRRDEIGAELEGYQHKIRLGFSSVTVGDVVQLISEVETAAAIENTMGMEITRLQGEVERQAKECLRQKLALQEVKTANMELAQLLPSHLKQERDAALAEVERLEARDEKQASMIRSIDPLYR